MLWKWDFQNVFFFYFFVCHKLGCFKRRKIDGKQEEENAHEDESTLAPTTPPDSKSEEDKALLKGTEANSNTLSEDSKEELDWRTDLWLLPGTEMYTHQVWSREQCCKWKCLI